MKNRRYLRSLLLPALLIFAASAWAQTKKNCEQLRQEATDARKEYEQARLSGNQHDIDAARKEYDQARKRWHDCAHNTPAATGGRKAPPCNYEHEWVEDREKAWNDKFFKTGQNDRELKQKWTEALRDYCKCLVREGVDPLPDECKEPGVLEEAPPPAKKEMAPPPPPKAVAPPPPTKSATPPPPPKSPPPPPPPSTGAVSPPAPTGSTYICGKSPCNCSKQSPPKVCKAGSGCVCTKG